MMINIEQIALHIIRFMKDQRMSQQEAYKKALYTLNIQELTSEQEKLVQDHIKKHQDQTEKDKNVLDRHENQVQSQQNEIKQEQPKKG